MPLNAGDLPAVVVCGLVTAPVATGLLWAAAAASLRSDAVVAAVFLVAWVVIALPLSVLVGRFVARHVTGLPEEES